MQCLQQRTLNILIFIYIINPNSPSGPELNMGTMVAFLFEFCLLSRWAHSVFFFITIIENPPVYAAERMCEVLWVVN